MKSYVAAALVLAASISVADARQILLLGSDAYGHSTRMLIDTQPSRSAQPGFDLRLSEQRTAGPAFVQTPDTGIVRSGR